MYIFFKFIQFQTYYVFLRLQVTLELIMWIIFAGVSILMTVIFTFDDIYCKNVQYGNRQNDLYVTVHDNNDKNSHIIQSPKFEKQEC